METSRRQFHRMAAGGALAAGKAAGQRPPWPAGMKLSVQVSADPTEEELQFVRQLGVGYVNIPGSGATGTYENYARLRQKVEAAGLKVWNIGNASVHNMEEVTLNLAGRDQKIEEYKNYLRNLARAGIYYTTYAHMGNGIWSTAPEATRGGARARAFDQAKAEQGNWAGKVFRGPLTHGRRYSAQELWDNYAYFIKQVAPVAEELGMWIGIHPDDPPAPELGGVPRPIFSSFEGYRRALEMAGSPHIGMCLCVGCWLEGGKLMGRDVLETIRYFGRQGRIFKVHLRNVNAPLPHFVETFVDDGYADMYKVMRALGEVNFSGAVIADHIPAMVGGRYAGTAYSVGYMKALLDRVNAELGRAAS